MPNRRKPTAIREREGNRSRTPIPKEPDIEAVSKPGVPDWYPASAKQFYQRYAPSIRALTKAGETDEAKLQAMALSWGFAMDAAKVASQEGVIQLDEQKVKRKHAALQVYRDNMMLFDKLSGQFGMSPEDRARLFAAEAGGSAKQQKAPGDGVLSGEWSADAAQLQ